ncbi:class I SAM-dependent methyltransferase, partial [Dolichospermum sp. ST_sed5]|nr:class I SAM-dependent methyltransferase [Dolichospermum sp. ST_sed5]
MSDKMLTWEEAVQWLRDQPEQQELVQYCYYDDPLESAAERFSHSEEWTALNKLLKPKIPGKVLDIGAGRGISSYAFAKAGCSVTALEPDSSNLVGAGAIHRLAKNTDLSIQVVQDWGETLPFTDNYFDIVYGRAVLHHAQNLKQLCQEAARVLKPGGYFIATREHIISRKEDL